MGSGTDDTGSVGVVGTIGCPGGVIVGGGVPDGGVGVDEGGVTGGNKIGMIGITGVAGDAGVNGGSSLGGGAELGGRTGGKLPIFAGGTEASSLGTRVSANCIWLPNCIGGIDSMVAGGSSSLTSLCGLSERRFPQRARAQLEPSVSSTSPLGMRSFFFVQ